MVPSRRSSNSSRRSSILKPPKPRQPLQNLNFNNSSSDSSPISTIKMKRRVSFAEKKHVKEFCNSMEQGTIWDSTYEEHDTSNLKVSCTPSNENCDIQIIDIQDSEIIQKDLNVENCDINSINIVESIQCNGALLTQKELLTNASSITFSNTVNQENKSNFAIDAQLNSNDHIHKSVIVYNDPVEDVANKIVCSQQSSKSNVSLNNMNITCIQDTDMSFNKNICDSVYTESNYIENNELKSTNKITTPMNIFVRNTQSSMNLLQEQNIEEHNTTMKKGAGQSILMQTNIAGPTMCKPIVNFDTAKSGIEKFDASMEMTAAIVSTIQKEDCKLISMPRDNDNEITTFYDTSMDITEPIKTSSNINIYESELSDRLLPQKVLQYKHNITCVDEMTIEMTEAVPVNVYSVNPDNSTIYTDTEMEFTKALTSLVKVPSNNLNNNKAAYNTSYARNFHNSISNNYRSDDINLASDRTRIFHNTSMTTTAVVSPLSMANACEKEMLDCESNLNNQEFDRPNDINLVSDRTRIFHNTSMTTTAVVSPLSMADTCEKEMLDRESNLNNQKFDRPDDINLVSDRTRIFHNTSMTTTAVVSPLSMADACEKEMLDCESNLNSQEFDRTVLFPNMSMQITEAVPLLQSNNHVEYTAMNSAEIGKLPLSEKTENKSLCNDSLNQITIPDNILKDITASVIPSSVNSNACLNEESGIITSSRNLKDSLINEPTQNEVQNSINIGIGMTLHDSIEKDTGASALKENNTNTVSASLNIVPNDPFCTITSEINQNECIQLEHLQDTISHIEKTCIIKPFTDHSFTSSNKENINISELNNVVQDNYKQSLAKRSFPFCNESLEELKAIEPPSFIYLDNLSDESVNVSYNQGIDTERIERFMVTERTDTTNFRYSDQDCISVQNNQINILGENTNKSEIFLNEYAILNDKSLSLKLEREDLVQISEAQKLQLSHMTNTNIEPQPDCSLPTITDTEKICISNIKQKTQDVNTQNVCKDNSNVEDQSMEYFSLNINDNYDGTSKADIENSYLCNDKLKLCNDQNLSNAMNTKPKKRKNLGSHDSSVKNDISIELDAFSLLIKELKVCAKSNEIIWDVYHENIEKKMIIIGFMSCSLLIVIYSNNDCNITNAQFIKNIKIISRLADDADVFISIVHRLILKKLDVKKLMDFYKNNEDILPMLEYISTEVKLAMDFMFDLKYLDSLNSMEITHNSISFISHAIKMDVILKITINIKPFEKIESQDISVDCLLGSVSEKNIKQLIMNVKRDHKFFRRCINDVKDYIYIIEESSSTNKIPR